MAHPPDDNRADDLTKDGMLKGIEQAAAFILFLSVGVLKRPYCQMEIRHALALKKPVVLLHGKKDFSRPIPAESDSQLPFLLHGTESDARHGGYNFRAAHEAAPSDLQELLDNNESLPFRRRGYGELPVVHLSR